MTSSHDPTDKPALFTDQLRAASRGSHANNTAVVASKLLVVLTHREQYGRALSCFEHVHCALQAHLASACASQPELQLLGLVLPSIQRGEAFREDVSFFLGCAPHHPHSAQKTLTHDRGHYSSWLPFSKHRGTQ